MFCLHIWGEVKDGYQYCNKCGKAIPVECSHKWETIREMKITRYMYSSTVQIGILYTLKCTICGDVKKKQVDIE